MIFDCNIAISVSTLHIDVKKEAFFLLFFDHHYHHHHGITVLYVVFILAVSLLHYVITSTLRMIIDFQITMAAAAVKGVPVYSIFLAQ